MTACRNSTDHSTDRQQRNASVHAVNRTSVRRRRSLHAPSNPRRARAPPSERPAERASARANTSRARSRTQISTATVTADNAEPPNATSKPTPAPPRTRQNPTRWKTRAALSAQPSWQSRANNASPASSVGPREASALNAYGTPRAGPTERPRAHGPIHFDPGSASQARLRGRRPDRFRSRRWPGTRASRCRTRSGFFRTEPGRRFQHESRRTGHDRRDTEKNDSRALHRHRNTGRRRARRRKQDPNFNQRRQRATRTRGST